MQNPFRNPDLDEVKKREKTKKEIESRLKTISEIGRRILDSSDGIHYKEELTKQRDAIIKLAMVNTESDPIKYALFCKATFSSLSVLYSLIESVEKDARR
jgi:hypothetical protein